MKPLARSDRLIKHVVGQDMLVYDPADDSACCLNSLASLVWRHCDGAHAVSELGALVAGEVDLPDDLDPEDVVWEVLDELQKHGLLATPAQELRAARRSRLPRRDVVKALAMLPLFPMIQQITAPTSLTAASPPPPASASGSVAATATAMASASATATASGTVPHASLSASGTPAPSLSRPNPSASATPTPT